MTDKVVVWLRDFDNGVSYYRFSLFLKRIVEMEETSNRLK
jgi:hypothetical protein